MPARSSSVPLEVVSYAIALLAFLSVPDVLVAQSIHGATAAPSTTQPRTVTNGHTVPVPIAHATRRTLPVVLDGKLDDSAWQEATPISGFVQYDPDEGTPASQRTEVRFLFDDDALYVGARMYDTEGPKGIRTQLSRRDAQFDSDWISIIIDGYHDHLGRALFAVNPSGSRQDMIGSGSSCCEAGWDPVWEAAAGIDDSGWSAEIRIPLNQLRFSREASQTWGLQVQRFIQRRNEMSLWSFFRRNETGGAARYGHLDGIEIARQPRHLEVLPYAVSRVKAVQVAPGNPFNDGRTRDAREGVDLKYLLTPNLTLDATINPDFGQVEVDPATVNLSAFEEYFEERRPFFVEGAGIFRTRGTRCMFCSNSAGVESFYSRRIGRAPTGASLAYAEGTYADVPEASTILGAAKITGRTAGGYTVGLLNATTRQESARVQRADGSRTSVAVEPLTNFLVGRLVRDFRRGDIQTGLFASSVTRRLPESFRSTLNAHSEMLAWDLESNWKNKAYSLRATLLASNISGDPRAITARQRSSARYFQRPDDRRAVDTLATSMQGAGWYVRGAKDAGEWQWELQTNARTPGYEVNDIALQNRADYQWFNGNVGRYLSKPTKWYRTLFMSLGGQYQRSFQGQEVPGRQLQFGASANTPNFWTVNFFAIARPSVLEDRILRGGPSVYIPGGGTVNAFFATDSRKNLQATLFDQYSWNDARGLGNTLGLSIRARPTSYVSVSAGPSLARVRSVRQYVQAVGDPTALAFGGTRYVLSDLEQNTLSMDTRLNITFSPAMSFELYAQPFFGSGRYSDFKEYRAPHGHDVAVFGRDVGSSTPVRSSDGRIASYTIDPDGAGPAAAFSLANPDFNLRSLRENAVFRWEYRPGSTLYLVWAQTRSSSASEGDFDFSRDQQALFASRPDNIFLVKMNWWLSR